MFDRIFVLALVGLVYFQLGPPTTWSLAAVFAAAIGFFVYTTPHRFGFCVGLAHGVALRWLEESSEGEDELSSR